MKAIKAHDIMLGNLISVFGYTEMVTGITPRPDGSFFVSHTGIHQALNPIPDGIEYELSGIILTDEWRVLLRVEKYKLPNFIEYVHEVQNFLKAYVGINVHEYIDYKNLPSPTTP